MLNEELTVPHGQYAAVIVRTIVGLSLGDYQRDVRWQIRLIKVRRLAHKSQLNGNAHKPDVVNWDRKL